MSNLAEVFEYRDGFRGKVPPEIAGPELLRIAAGRGLEAVPASEIVLAATPKSSPLHPAFTWDNNEAAQQYRLEQARYLVRSIVVHVERHGAEPKLVRLFVNLRDGKGSRLTAHVESDDKARERLIGLALDDLRSARANLAMVRGLGAVVGKLMAIEREILRKRKGKRKGK